MYWWCDDADRHALSRPDPRALAGCPDATEPQAGPGVPRSRRSFVASAPVGTRTPNLLIRSQMLYPIELRALECDSVAEGVCAIPTTLAGTGVPSEVRHVATGRQ